MEAAKQVLGPRFEAVCLFAQALEWLLDFIQVLAACQPQRLLGAVYAGMCATALMMA